MAATGNYNAHDWKVGDIIDGTFRYTASIPKFYVVSRRADKCIWLMSIGKVSRAYDRYGQEGVCEPDPAIRGRERLHRINKGGFVKIDNYTTAKKWNGKPVEFYGD